MAGKPRAFLTTYLLPILALWLFTGLAARNLTLPGLHADEAQEAGLQAQQILAGTPVTAFRGAAVTVASVQFPLMVQDYIGALNVALAVPFLAFVGNGVFALRLMAVFIGVATIALSAALARQLGGARAAGVAALLLAVQPSFLFWSRQGVFVTSITGALALAFLWALAAWLRRPDRWRRAALAGLFAGLGIYAKLLFLWVLGGVVVMGALVLAIGFVTRSRDTRHATRNTNYILRIAYWALPPFLLGLAPLFVYNVLTGGTLTSVSGNLTTSFYGVDNLNIAVNLATRWDQLRAVLAGRDHLWYLGGSFGNPATEWLLAGALLALAARAAARRPGAALPLALAGVAVVAFLQTVFTVSGLFPTHFAVLLPLFPMLIALGADGLWRDLLPPAPTRTWSDEGAMRVLGAGALALALLGLGWRDVWVDGGYLEAVERTGGLNAHSDAVYALADYLDEAHNGQPVVALDWGYAPSVQFLTAGRVAPLESFGYTQEADADFAARLAESLAEPATVYILHWPQETIFPRREAFEAALAERGLRAISLATFSRRDGAPIFEVVRTTADD